jgi:fructose-bisphosphate aldolase class 1
MSVPRKRIAECICCAHLICDPVDFERALPGILILSSGQGDSRGDQGLCRIHQRLVTREMTCSHFRRRPADG